MVSLGHGAYEKFKITPTTSNSPSYTTTYVNLSALKMNMMAALRVMAAEFNTGSPAHDLSAYGAASGVSVSQNANPVNNANNHQEQHQEINLTLDHAIEATLDYVRQNYSEDKIAEATEVLVPIKKGNAPWPKIKKAVDFFTGLSREAFFAFAPVLLQLSMQKG